MKTLFTRIHAIRNQSRHNEQGFTLLELLVVIGLLGVVGSAAASLIINMTQTAADFNNPEDCFNQGRTAERLCQIQQIAISVKGTNEDRSSEGSVLMPFVKTRDFVPLDRTAVLPHVGTEDPASLVWQVATMVGGDVCIVGYDLSDPTSKFTHANPFVYSTTYKTESQGVGCGTRNSNGTYTWANDPTVAKPVHVLTPNTPDPVRVVGTGTNVINGTIDAIREGQTVNVVITKSYEAVAGQSHGPITFDVNYVCSNGYTKTERMVADIATPDSTWKGHLYTYGGAVNESLPCNPKTVALIAVTGVQWTLGNTENFTFS